jgi:hypothetical protein
MAPKLQRVVAAVKFLHDMIPRRLPLRLPCVRPPHIIIHTSYIYTTGGRIMGGRPAGAAPAHSPW